MILRKIISSIIISGIYISTERFVLLKLLLRSGLRSDNMKVSLVALRINVTFVTIRFVLKGVMVGYSRRNVCYVERFLSLCI